MDSSDKVEDTVNGSTAGNHLWDWRRTEPTLRTLLNGLFEALIIYKCTRTGKKGGIEVSIIQVHENGRLAEMRGIE